jgi:hypothetical protein
LGQGDPRCAIGIFFVEVFEMAWKPTIKKRAWIQPLTSEGRVEKLQDQIRRASYKEEKLVLQRNLSFGAAAASFVLLATLMQVGITSKSLLITLYAASVALPFWVLQAFIYEVFIFLEDRGYPFYSSAASQVFVITSWLLGALSLFGATVGVIAHLMFEAALIFGIVSGLCVILYLLFLSWSTLWWIRTFQRPR